MNETNENGIIFRPLHNIQISAYANTNNIHSFIHSLALLNKYRPLSSLVRS